MRLLTAALCSLLFLAPDASAQISCDASTPRLNRPTRTGTDPSGDASALFVLVTQTGVGPMAETVPPPVSTQEAMVMADDLRTLTDAVSFGNYDLVFPHSQLLELSIDVSTYPAGLSAPEMQVRILSDAIALANGQSIDLTDLDQVAFFVGNPTEEFWDTVSVGPYAWIVNSVGGAAAVFHELGHGAALPHSNSVQSKENITKAGNTYSLPAGRHSGIEYGDIYDLMGLGIRTNGNRPRSRFSALGKTFDFAPVDEISLHPLRMLQHGWIPESEILNVSSNGSYLVGELSRAGTVKALEIDRSVLTNKCMETIVNKTAESLYVYWRDSEPLANAGVSIGLGARETVGANVKVLELFEDPNVALEGLETTLLPGESLHDLETNTLITFLGFVAVTTGTSNPIPYADVQVVSLGDGGFPQHPEVPNVHVELRKPDSSVVDRRDIYTDGTLTIQVDAWEPSTAGTCWAGVEYVDVEVLVGEAGPCSAQTALGTQRLTASNNTYVFDLDANLPAGTGNVFRGVVGLKFTAKSADGSAANSQYNSGRISLVVER